MCVCMCVCVCVCVLKQTKNNEKKKKISRNTCYDTQNKAESVMDEVLKQKKTTDRIKQHVKTEHSVIDCVLTLK